MNYELEDRNCKNCKGHFRVLPKDKQEFCSWDCQHIAKTPQEKMKAFGHKSPKKAAPPKPPKAPKARPQRKKELGQKSIKKESEKKDDSDTKPIPSIEKNNKQKQENDISKTLPSIIKEDGKMPTKTQMPEEKNGTNIIETTENDLISKSNSENISVIRLEDYTVTSNDLRMVKSDSMHLLDSASEQLFALMKGLTHDKPPHEIRRVETYIADSAAKLAQELREMLKLKLSVVKFAHEIEGERERERGRGTANRKPKTAAFGNA